MASYPKSGNTWCRLFLSNYFSDSDSPLFPDQITFNLTSSSTPDFEKVTGWNPYELYKEEIDSLRPDVFKFINENYYPDKSNLFIKAHEANYMLPNGKHLFSPEVTAGVVYFVRNPLDVCVSFANHQGASIDDRIELLLNPEGTLIGQPTGQYAQFMGTWDYHVNSWVNQSCYPVCLVKYEDMLVNPNDEFERILRFLGINPDQNRLGKAILNSCFATLKKIENKSGFRERKQVCKSFFWKGTAGYHKDFLDQGQIDRIVTKLGYTMKSLGYL